ncbi:MAG: T9SS type A sorting domain-containing protein [Ignavibacteria bacterium]|nr:T9SS type A sorting domain-containing protein [Ignavibacteria bacterium]
MPKPPKPPLTFSVNSDSENVSLLWTIDESTPPEGFKIYRTSGKRYNTYQLIAELPSNTRSFIDTILQAHTDYYYYLTSVGAYQLGGPATPPGKLESGRFYTQTYNPVQVDIGTFVNNTSNTIYNYALSQNYPNPFNPTTVINYQLPIAGLVTLKVYDLLGREIATLVNKEKTAGSYEVEFRSSVGGHQLANGVYFYRLQVEDPSTSQPAGRQGSGKVYVETKKMILLR